MATAAPALVYERSGIMCAFPRMADRKEPKPRVAEDRRASLDAESSFDLIHRAHGGDDLARDVLFTRYYRRLQAWAHGRLPAYARGPNDTLDLVQDTMLQVFRNFDNFEPKHTGAFLAFVRTTLKNKIVDRIRQARVRPAGDPLDDSHPADEPLPDQLFVATELLERYEEALERLSPAAREAIILRIELRLSWAEIMEALGKPSIPATQMAVKRALLRLAREMKHEIAP
jgi:RNA polymerase sigma-70 factor (ECF subfamily)